MARRGSGPRIRWRKGQWSIFWTQNGVTRERRTGATDRRAAEGLFSDWLVEGHQRPVGLRRAADTLIADCLAEYAEEHGPQTANPERIAHAIDRLLDWWGDNMVDDVSKATCQGYTEHRRKAGIKENTIRRELSALSSAIGHAHDSGRLPEKAKGLAPRGRAGEGPLVDPQ